MITILDYVVIIQLWISVIIYAVLEGADFGGGILSFFAFGEQKEAQQSFVEEAIGPVWEANNVWLTYLVVGLFTGFPIVMQLLTTALFIPIAFILIGIVLRGSSVVFHTFSGHTLLIKKTWQRTFGIASTITPFLYGAAGAAVASGALHMVHGHMPIGLVWAWTTPFAIMIGLVGMALSATLAAVYLTVEAEGQQRLELVKIFRRRGFIAGSIMALLGMVALGLMPSEATPLWDGLTNHGYWALAITAVLGAAAAAALFFRRYRLTRVLMILQTAGVLGTWGVSQAPYIVPPDFTITQAASPPLTMLELFITAFVGMGMLVPALWFLFHVFKGAHVVPPYREKEVEGV
jgi:cytochrome d ubiquinol oxidase subunit II